MSWADWYALETAASMEKIIFNWVFFIAVGVGAKMLADRWCNRD